MYRIRGSTTVSSLPAAADSGAVGYFTPGAPGGIAATILTAEWFNRAQEELIAPIEAAGLVLSPTDNTQLLQAIRWLASNDEANREVILQKALGSGATGQIFTVGGGWQDAEIDTEAADLGSLCTLNANRFVLAAGTYHADARVQLSGVSVAAQLRLRNITDSATLLTGPTAIANTTYGIMNPWLGGAFTIAAGKSLALQVFPGQMTTPTSCYQIAAATGEPNVVTLLRLRKVV